MLQGHRKMLLDGGADLVVAQPGNFFYVHALKSILVHSETNYN